MGGKSLKENKKSPFEKEYKIAWDKYSEEELKRVFDLSERFIDFMSRCKTERECVQEFTSRAEKLDYKNLQDLIKQNMTLKPGDKVYAEIMGKTIAFFVIGKKPLEDGLRILGAHVDSPRLDLKQNPLYEDADLALFETHYYGGIKKYQWVTFLAIHGVVVKDGTLVNIVIGEDEDDPVLGVSDLLIHLAKDQMKKPAEGVEAKTQHPRWVWAKATDETKDRVKHNILKLLMMI